jgi:serine/threonine-protein kinase HipA
LMAERFDRQRTERGYFRFGVVSALTALDADDGYFGRERWSYPRFADQLRRRSRQPVQDCLELFRRMVFNAAVTNNDDHPRNHALLRGADGWRLSPLYDVVPVPLISLERRDLALTVGRYGRTASLYNLISQCDRFGLSGDEARSEVQNMAAMVGSWRECFAADGVSSQDIAYIAPAFLPPCFFSEAAPDA